MVGMSKSAQNGVIFKGGDVLEMLGKIDVAVFDKTGTLTQGKPQVIDIITVKNGTFDQDTSDENDKLLQIAATVEKNSEHPLAKSIVQKARELNLEVGEASEFFVTPGKGASATYNNNIYVGSTGFIESQGIDIKSAETVISQMQHEGKTVVLVASGKELLGILALLDTVKPSARGTLNALKKMGIKIIMLTGDNKKTATTIARELAVDEIIANVMPSEKVDVIRNLQKEGKKIAMIGDGINDAAALSQSDVGIAIGSGTDVALEAGKVVLIRDDLTDVVAAIEISKKTVSKIRQNLFYAFIYNAVLIPIAGVGLLYPALAGLAMALSSVSVTSSSLLLKRWSPSSKKQRDEETTIQIGNGYDFRYSICGNGL
jgi:Cu+-exporting ATPase